MYHAHLKGTHYEIGFHWGSLLEKHGHFILNNLPFPIKKERKAFALACVPVYQKYFPEILEEIQGLADGQHCEAEMLQAVLFSMYAMPPACHCSCFAVADHETILFGRNSDFLTELEKYNLKSGKEGIQCPNQVWSFIPPLCRRRGRLPFRRTVSMCFFTMGSIHLPIRNGEMARLPPNYLTPPGKARINGWKPYLPQALRE